MAYYSLHPDPGARRGPWDLVRSRELFGWTLFSLLFDWALAAIVERYLQRQRLSELRSLSNRSFKDLGLHRSEAVSVVYGDGIGPKERRHVAA